MKEIPDIEHYSFMRHIRYYSFMQFYYLCIYQALVMKLSAPCQKLLRWQKVLSPFF